MIWKFGLAFLLYPSASLGVEFGWTASLHNWPFIAGLYVSDQSNTVIYCTGTIITDLLILTTAECMYRKPAKLKTPIFQQNVKDLRVRVGSSFAYVINKFEENTESQECRVLKVHLPTDNDLKETFFDHPNITKNEYTWRGKLYYYLDFAILELVLEDRLRWNRFVQPVIFDTKAYTKDTEFEYYLWKREFDAGRDWMADCYMAGWGFDQTYEDKLSPKLPRLMFNRMKYMPKLDCDLAICTNCALCGRDNSSIPEEVPGLLWCFSSYISGETCPEDQGAPLFCPWFGYKDKADQTMGAILGILSGTPGQCNRVSQPGKYIAIWYAYPFIERVVGLGKWPPPPPQFQDPDFL